MYRVLTLPGDGIGPEVVSAAMAVVTAAAHRQGVEIAWTTRDCGAAYHQRTGHAIDPGTRAAIPGADAVLLGAVGLPSLRRADGGEIADEVVLDIRSDLDLFANVRPVRSWPGVPGPLGRSDIAFTVVRENTEGLYASRLGGVALADKLVVDSMVVTREGTERVVRHAFEIARRSRGAPRDGVRRVTCVDKANTLKGYVFFRKVFLEVAAEFPEIEAECALADSMTARMVLMPDSLDVIVCENMIGDILSDLAAALVGGLGFAPSANIGAANGMFEPTHGSAPDIAGRDAANPTAAVLSGAMMLRWFGEHRQDPASIRAAETIEHAVERALAEGIRTADAGGSVGTAAMTDAIVERLEDS